jgi:ribosomal protein S18 acetylase RimI-like enzyme
MGSPALGRGTHPIIIANASARMSDTIFEGGSFRLKRLRPEADGAAIDALSQSCADYTLMLTGEPPSHDGGADFFAAIPNGKTPGDMLKLGVFDPAGMLVGLMDIARDHPTPGTWYLGLLLLDPAVRGQGVGAAVMRGVREEAARNGATGLMLSVVAENARALKFWRAQGFAVTRELPAKRFGSKHHARLELISKI